MKEISTEIANKWWDNLSHENKEYYLSKMNSFNWGRPKKIYLLSKFQKIELYYQVHKMFGRSLNL